MFRELNPTTGGLGRVYFTGAATPVANRATVARMDYAIDLAREAVLREFRWIHGHSDVWRLAEDGAIFASIVAGLAALAARHEPSAIAGIETRGVLFGAPVARALGLGFHTIRKGDGLFAGSAHSVEAAPDYRGISHTLRSRGAFAPGARVVLVDDWIEKGSQADAARRLILDAGASLVGVVTIVDQSDGRLEPGSLMRADELPPDDGD